MSETFSVIIGIVATIWEAIASSALFSVLVIFLAIYSLVIIADLVLLLILRDIPSDMKKTLYGGNRPAISPSKFAKRWEAIFQRVSSKNPSQYKVAILEADALAQEILLGLGYEGENMKERLDSVQPGHIASLPELMAGHAVRNRIIQEANFSLSKEEAKLFLEGYRKFFIELELL